MVNPTYVDFSIYPYCNLRCDFCYAEAECESTISNHLLKVSDFEDIFEQFDQIGILRVGFEGGEPFLRKDWFEILKLADKHYFNYFVNTNATMIDESIAKKLAQTNVDRICVSLDGPTAQIHDKSRGKSGTFELTKRGIINLMNCGIAVDGIITLTKYSLLRTACMGNWDDWLDRFPFLTGKFITADFHADCLFLPLGYHLFMSFSCTFGYFFTFQIHPKKKGITPMRLDKYLKVSRLIKRRTVANEVADAGRILINGKVAKASQAVNAGDIIEVTFGNRPIKVRVLSDEEPRTKDVAREMYEVIAE